MNFPPPVKDRPPGAGGYPVAYLGYQVTYFGYSVAYFLYSMAYFGYPMPHFTRFDTLAASLTSGFVLVKPTTPIKPFFFNVPTPKVYKHLPTILKNRENS